MFRDEKNLKDSTVRTDLALTDTPFPLSYTKTNKLITALYMVTDIIDKGEPLRNKLRTLATEILSDTYSSSPRAGTKIRELVSFLDIAQAMNIITEMNCNILRKEFDELDQSIKEFTGRSVTENRFIDLSEFLSMPDEKAGSTDRTMSLGVQKGSTLLKALSDKNIHTPSSSRTNGEVAKGQRRLDILNIIKSIGGSATIKDIKDKGATLPEKDNSINICSEKTIQRELISMVKDGVLNKTGEKRWSRYSVK